MERYSKVVVAMDSMKGCLDSYQASLAIKQGLQEAFPGIEVMLRPVSDGGEGMTAMIAYGRSDFSESSCVVTGPVCECVTAKWIMQASEAYIDFASGAGLTLVDEMRRDPLQTTSYGVGEMIDAALKSGKYSVKLGLGGSGTVDGGLGALQALGLRLLDKNGGELPKPFKGGMLRELEDFELTDLFKEKVGRLKLTLLCDVEAPFTGINGAARVFGPQKGADEAGVEQLEAGLEKLRRLILKKTGINLNEHPGTGAAGGAAGGLMALAGGVIRKGASTLLDLTGFEGEIAGADLIITGEGGSDRQTLMGKIPYEILQRGKRKGIPVWLVAGRVSDREQLETAGFERVISINSSEIVERSGTIGQNPLDPSVASQRLRRLFCNRRFDN